MAFMQLRYMYVKGKLNRIHRENLEAQKNAYKKHIKDDAAAQKQGVKDVKEKLKKTDAGSHNPHRGDE